MEKLLKKFHSGAIAQFNATQVLETPTSLQQILSQYQRVFEAPKGLPPSRGEHDHGIPLILSSQPRRSLSPPFYAK